MKILVINKFLYPKGGDAISALEAAELLRSKGHEVFVWGMKSSENESFSFSELFIDEVDLNDIQGAGKKLKAAGNMLYSLEAKKKIKAMMQKTGAPEIVHLHNFAHQISPSILHVFKEMGIPCVMTMHDYKMVCASYTLLNNTAICEKCSGGRHYNCFFNKCVKNSRAKSLLNTVEMYLHHKLLKIYDLVDVFISPSRFLKNKVKEMGFEGKVEYLPNFISLEDYRADYAFETKTICYLGRLSEEKGVPTLIKAVKGLDVTLKVIGDGPLKEKLEDKLERDGQKNVQFLGYKTGEELKNEIRESMFMVIPSECYENNPRSVIEAFALGKPVIGANIGGIPELVKDNVTGISFESGNAEDLRFKIEELAGSPDKVIEMGENARSFVEKELNSEKHYERLMEIYASIIDK